MRVKDKPAARSDPDVQTAVDRVSKMLENMDRVLVRKNWHRAGDLSHGEGGDGLNCEQYLNEIVKVIQEEGHLV